MIIDMHVLALGSQTMLILVEISLILSNLMKCEVCCSEDVIDVLDLGEQPLCDDLIPIGSNENCKLYPIKIAFCNTCGTALQKHQIERNTLFPANYHYRAKRTPSVLESMERLVSKVDKLTKKDNRTQIVLDVGCNDGALLDYFKEKGFKTFGIDPTNAADEAGKNHFVIKDYFDKSSSNMLHDCIGGFPDIITFTNCFAHINNFKELISSLSALMGENTLLVIENHYLGTVLNTNQFDTFYHEHPRTYSYHSFRAIAERLNAKIIDCCFTTRYGGNIQVFISKNGIRSVVETDETCQELLLKFKTMSNYVPKWKEEKLRELEDLVKENGPLKGIGFPGRASILTNLLGLNEQMLSATYEIKGSIKTGNYIPGSRIPILPEVELFTNYADTGTLLNLAWHIEKDVVKNLKANEIECNLVSLM
jgi:hypothetical protein